MKSVIMAAVAALSLTAFAAQAAEKPASPAAAPKVATADTTDAACKKAKEDCTKAGKSEAECQADAAVQAACKPQ